MARQLRHLVERPRTCSYLSDRVASLEHRILLDTTPDELEALLVRGWRRFGPDYFRPRCGGCDECVPVRIPTAAFRASKSQRRALRLARRMRLVVGTPRVDDERLALYHRWHAFREEQRDWAPSMLDAESYALHFAFPHPAAREVAWYDDGEEAERGRLVAVALCDETPRAWSAVYFYYDPDYARFSPGVASIPLQVAIAASRGIPHVYLGYLVERCRSMAYKARFAPLERLAGWPSPAEEPRWVPFVPRAPLRSEEKQGIG